MRCVALRCIALHCIALYCIALHCIVWYGSVLYCILLYYIVFYCILLYSIVFYCILLYSIVLYCIVLYSIELYLCASGDRHLQGYPARATDVIQASVPGLGRRARLGDGRIHRRLDSNRRHHTVVPQWSIRGKCRFSDYLNKVKVSTYFSVILFASF